MRVNHRRREFMQAALAVSAVSSLGLSADLCAGTAMRFGPTRAFSFEELRRRARTRAGLAYTAPPRPAPDITAKIDYATRGQKIPQRIRAVCRRTGRPSGHIFPSRKVFPEVGKDQRRGAWPGPGGVVSRGPFRRHACRLHSPPPSRRRGFAGFHIQESRAGTLEWKRKDWVAFLGASYFRAIGELHQYGLSARGLAVDLANPQPPFVEEFLDSLRHNIGIVFQESALLHRSIADNIRIGRPEATDEEVMQAARSAEAHEFIMRQSGGYDTLVGERGSTLSGGERQRTAIARALTKDPPVLIPDEATRAAARHSSLRTGFPPYAA